MTEVFYVLFWPSRSRISWVCYEADVMMWVSVYFIVVCFRKSISSSKYEFKLFSTFLDSSYVCIISSSKKSFLFPQILGSGFLSFLFLPSHFLPSPSFFFSFLFLLII